MTRQKTRPATHVFWLVFALITLLNVHGLTTGPKKDIDTSTYPEFLRNKYSHWREAAGDGDCFFRSFAYLVLEQTVSQGRLEFETLFTNMDSLLDPPLKVDGKTEPYSKNKNGDVSAATKDSDLTLLRNKMNPILDLKSPEDRVKRFETVAKPDEFDDAMVRFFRYAVAKQLEIRSTSVDRNDHIDQAITSKAWINPVVYNYAPFVAGDDSPLYFTGNDVETLKRTNYPDSGFLTAHGMHVPDDAQINMHVKFTPSHTDMLYVRPAGSPPPPPLPHTEPEGSGGSGRWYDPVYVKVLLALSGVVVLSCIAVGFYFIVTSFAAEAPLEPVADIV